MSEPRGLTSWRVLVAVVVAVVGTVALGVWALQQQIRSRTLDSTVKGVTILSSVVIDRSLTLTDLHDGIHPSNRAKLDADMVLLKGRGAVKSLAIWSLDNGRLVYADIDYPGATDLSPALVARARQGQPFLAAPEDNPDPGTLKIYYPYDANGDHITDAVAAVILPRQEVDRSIARSTALLYGGGALVLLIALAGIAQVRRRQIGQDYAANHDSLTGIGNRALLRRTAEPAITTATERTPVGLLLIDLDDFKAVNDSLGHHAGDELLITVAHIAVKASEPGGIPIRLGGDEFAVLLTRLDKPDDARTIAERIHWELRQPLRIAGHDLEIDASIGLAYAPSDATSLGVLLRCADIAMYQAKHSGGGVVAYEAAAGMPVDRSLTILPELRQALSNGQLEVFYQPVRRADNAIGGLEAVLRWHHPERGLLDGSEFLPAVEHTSFMGPLTDWVLRTALHQCAQWREAGHDLRVAVNISARTLLDDTLPELVTNVATAAGVPLSAVDLEVTETALVNETDRAIQALRRLQGIGVFLTLDNVGAAYGSLSAIASAPVHRLKIDRRFASRVADSSYADAVVAGLVRVAGGLGMTTLADGVDNLPAWHRLLDMGCDEIQGTAVCPAMGAADMTHWLDHPEEHEE
jgi:diguanylate cyclase (GGDEF)-like protein